MNREDNGSSNNVGESTQFTEDSFTFKKKSAVDTSQMTNNSIFSKQSA
jgi:hypothetical protein